MRHDQWHTCLHNPSILDRLQIQEEADAETVFNASQGQRSYLKTQQQKQKYDRGSFEI